jgi:hypothetical protein
MSDDSVDESIEESFEDFEEESLAGSNSKSHVTSKADDSPPSGNEGYDVGLSADNSGSESFKLEESLAQTHDSEPPSPTKEDSHAPLSDEDAAGADESYIAKASPQSVRSEVASTPGSNKGSKEATSTPGSKKGSKEALASPGSKRGSKEAASKESAVATTDPISEEQTSTAKVPRLALTERGPWLSAGGCSSAKDHLMRSTDSRLFALRYPYSERTVIVRDPSPTFASARKIPRGLQKKMEEEKRQKEAEEGSSATGSQQLTTPKSQRKHLLYTMPQRSSDACWGEANREFRPYMRVKAEYVTPAGKKVTAFGKLLSGWEVPQSRLREGPHARPPKGKEPPTAKAVTALPLIEKERSQKYVRVMLHDGIEKTLPKSKVTNADPMDLFR